MPLKMRALVVASLGLIMLAAGAPASNAAGDPALDKEINRIAEDWAKAKYLSNDDSERQKKMDAIGEQADALVKRYPGRVEALIWDGIITSERASLTWGLTALSYATRARDMLLEAEKLELEGTGRRSADEPRGALLSRSRLPCRLGRQQQGPPIPGASGGERAQRPGCSLLLCRFPL